MSRARSHSFKMRGAKFKADVQGRFIFLSHRELWSPWVVLEGHMTVAFKWLLDRYVDVQGIKDIDHI